MSMIFFTEYLYEKIIPIWEMNGTMKKTIESGISAIPYIIQKMRKKTHYFNITISVNQCLVENMCIKMLVN